MEALLTLFESLTQQLEQLTELAKRKTITVRKNDLLALDQILKEEQAIALSLRGLEQKRVTLLQQLGLQNIPLSDLPTSAGRVAKAVLTARSAAITATATPTIRLPAPPPPGPRHLSPLLLPRPRISSLRI